MAQQRDTVNKKTDTAHVQVDTVRTKMDTTIHPATVIVFKNDSVVTAILSRNKILNGTATPVSLAIKVHNDKPQDGIFYLLAGLLLLLAFFKFFFARYFTNLFRVFFNSSLQQSQLTDQLLQAKLPSLLFNLFFIISTGLYCYFLLLHNHWITDDNKWLTIAASVAIIGIIYCIKFIVLKFTGWITGYKEEADTYVFITFLINKIIGIALVPIVILMAFSDAGIVNIAILVSLLVIGAMLLLRFFRSYGILQNQLKITGFHFLLYIFGIELLPLLLIYKGLVVFIK